MNGRNYRVYKAVNDKYFHEYKIESNYDPKDSKFKDLEDNDDVNSYSR